MTDPRCAVVVDHLCNDRDVCEDIPCGRSLPCSKHDIVDLDVEHIKLRDGRCVVSVNGQGHFPCDEHSEHS